MTDGTDEGKKFATLMLKTATTNFKTLIDDKRIPSLVKTQMALAHPAMSEYDLQLVDKALELYKQSIMDMLTFFEEQSFEGETPCVIPKEM